MFFRVFLLALVVVSCNAVSVTVDFYSDNRCTKKANDLTYDMGTCSKSTGDCDQSCFDWERNAIGGKHTDSANKFKAFKDWGIQYTQYVEKSDCTGLKSERQEARVNCCIQEPSGRLYSKISSSNGAALSGCATVPSNLPPVGNCSPSV